MNNLLSFYSAQGVLDLDQRFIAFVKQQSPTLVETLYQYRRNELTFTAQTESDFLLALGPLIEQFVIDTFEIEREARALTASVLAHDPIFQFKQLFVQRYAKRLLKQAATLPSFSDLHDWLLSQLSQMTANLVDLELAVAQYGARIIAELDEKAIERLTQWCVHARLTPEAQAIVSDWVSFALPGRCDHEHWVARQPVVEQEQGVAAWEAQSHRHRDGFRLTDKRMNQRQVQNEVHYCIYCHDHQGDFCSSGFPEKKNSPELGFKKDPFDQPLIGCPLEEKISEMHCLRRDGYVIGALAMIMRDNPMCPATGHRICNDCMKSCVYQKKDPVNIPEVESAILTDVLGLPWGVEIYNLLLRWNPLRAQQSCLQPYADKKVLIMGMGPAGFSLAYHLLMEGCAVVGLDGLKIEPLPQQLLDQPIKDFSDLHEPLDQRVTWGFGGVAEYGITVRWDKNFLKLIYLSLCRFQHFQVFGGVRFGGTLQVEDAWRLGFDHLALAVGAGLPKELPIPGSLAIGMRQANDFLMALQLTGAAKKNHMANLQIRLPALVIGGGLTGVDTATEVQAYYIAQIEKVAERYEALLQHHGHQVLSNTFQGVDEVILQEWLTHAHALKEERDLATQEGREPDLIKLIRSWGGVAIVYRGQMTASPAYKRNHEELGKALQEGLYYCEYLSPIEVLCDEHKHVHGLRCQGPDGLVDLPARSIFVATGAQPNVAYAFEHKDTFERNRYEYQAYEQMNDALSAVNYAEHCKDNHFGAFTSYVKDDKRVSFLGDTHPLFHGSVVKAIASAQRVYPKICELLPEKGGSEKDYQQFREEMAHAFTTVVTKKTTLAPGIVEFEIMAPNAAYRFKPGQFYRLQPFESKAAWVEDTCLHSEGIAVLGAGCKDGCVRLVLSEQGASSRLCQLIDEGDPVSLMGPTGVRMKVPEGNETILMLAGQMSLGMAVAFGQAVRKAGNRFYLILSLDEGQSSYYHDELLDNTDGMFVCQTRTSSQKNQSNQSSQWLTREQDGWADCLETSALLAWSAQIGYEQISRVIIHGPAEIVDIWRPWFVTHLQQHLAESTPVIASVYGPMQCMLKGVCAQCLQWQIDPKTNKRTKAVYCCSWQDQPMEKVDWPHLTDRLLQNRVQEKLSELWLDYLL